MWNLSKYRKEWNLKNNVTENAKPRRRNQHQKNITATEAEVLNQKQKKNHNTNKWDENPKSVEIDKVSISKK